MRHYYLQDANFNVTAIVDSAGTVVERYSYTPYGEVTIMDASFTTRASSLVANELLFTGRRTDPETGLQLNRNRFYDPQMAADHHLRVSARNYPAKNIDGTFLINAR